MSNLLTVQEVAHILRVDDTTVRRWVKQSTLEAVVLPNSWEWKHKRYRIKQEVFDVFSAEYRMEQPSEQSTN